jgi:hypothetical protein
VSPEAIGLLEAIGRYVQWWMSVFGLWLLVAALVARGLKGLS